MELTSALLAIATVILILIIIFHFDQRRIDSVMSKQESRIELFCTLDKLGLHLDTRELLRQDLKTMIMFHHKGLI